MSRSCPVPGRLQTKGTGTCWFHAIVNGWILSEPSRKIMKQKLYAFKQSHEMKPFTNIYACPMRGKLPAYFWSYVEYMIKYVEGKSKNTDEFHRKVMNNKEYSANNLIENMFVRSKAYTDLGQTKNVKMFLELLFPGNWSNEIGKDIFIKKFKADEKVYTPPGYRMLHAYIHIVNTQKTAAHAIMGGLCGKRAFIFDSSIKDIIYKDWREPLEPHTPGWYVHKKIVFYVKKKPTKNLYNAPTHLSKNKVNETKLKYYNAKTLWSIGERHTKFNKDFSKIFPVHRRVYYSQNKLRNFFIKMPKNNKNMYSLTAWFRPDYLTKQTGINLKANHSTYEKYSAYMNAKNRALNILRRKFNSQHNVS